MRRLHTLALWALMLPLAARAADPYSYAQPGRVQVKHLELKLTMDFKHRRLRGDATLSLHWSDPKARALVLDTQALSIHGVEAVDADGRTRALTYALAAPRKALGSKLTVTAPRHPLRVRIHYATSPTASGLQWLQAAQTADKRAPFMFSQSESMHARSWIPLQDTPAVRFTYAADITAPAGVRVVMSAIHDAKQASDGRFHFDQPRPIPSYLMAMAAGDIVAHKVGPRSAVYAEPSMLGKAAHELEDMEKMIDTAESLYGPYRWGRYDVLMLPPSFPFGGMENPNMTFATPTIIVGDKSLVSVISHELAHSWSGNLVTAAAWRDIWLNEGFTTYAQGRITEALYGKRVADEEVLLAAHALRKEIADMPANSQKLAPDPSAIAADDTLSDVAYDKGSWFLRMLEQRFGRKRLDTWLKGYFNRHAWHSITTEQMLADLKRHLIDRYPGRMSWAKANKWVYGTGIPKDAPLPDSPRFDAINARRKALLAGALQASKLDAGDWNTQEWMYFLDGLPKVTPLSKLKAIDAAWHLTGTPNAEIGMRWYRRAIAGGDTAVWPAAAAHIRHIGRLYLSMPLYKAFARTPRGLAYAKAVYAKAQAGYHPLTRQAVEALFAKAGKRVQWRRDAPACLLCERGFGLRCRQP